jgi:hypothetical protein
LIVRLFIYHSFVRPFEAVFALAERHPSRQYRFVLGSNPSVPVFFFNFGKILTREFLFKTICMGMGMVGNSLAYMHTPIPPDILDNAIPGVWVCFQCLTSTIHTYPRATLAFSSTPYIHTPIHWGGQYHTPYKTGVQCLLKRETKKAIRWLLRDIH